MAKDSRKSELIAELGRSRAAMATGIRGLRADLNLKRRVAKSVSQNQAAWIGGAGLAGFILARLSARRKNASAPGKSGKAKSEKKLVEAGIAVSVLKLGFDLVRPALTKWLTRRVTEYASQRFADGGRI